MHKALMLLFTSQTAAPPKQSSTDPSLSRDWACKQILWGGERPQEFEIEGLHRFSKGL